MGYRSEPYGEASKNKRGNFIWTYFFFILSSLFLIFLISPLLRVHSGSQVRSAMFILITGLWAVAVVCCTNAMARSWQEGCLFPPRCSTLSLASQEGRRNGAWAAFRTEPLLCERRGKQQSLGWFLQRWGIRRRLGAVGQALSLRLAFQLASFDSFKTRT